MNKKELQTLTIEQLNGMTEQALKAVADEALEKLNETEILGALVMSIMQSIRGK